MSEIMTVADVYTKALSVEPVENEADVAYAYSEDYISGLELVSYTRFIESINRELDQIDPIVYQRMISSRVHDHENGNREKTLAFNLGMRAALEQPIEHVKRMRVRT